MGWRRGSNFFGLLFLLVLPIFFVLRNRRFRLKTSNKQKIRENHQRVEPVHYLKRAIPTIFYFRLPTSTRPVSINLLFIDRCSPWSDAFNVFSYFFLGLFLTKGISAKIFEGRLHQNKRKCGKLDARWRERNSAWIVCYQFYIKGPAKSGGVSLAQWQYRNQWSSAEVRSLLVENLYQYPPGGREIPPAKAIFRDSFRGGI